MPNGGIPQKDFVKELDRVQLSRRHAEQAFAWMRISGQKGVYDIWYHETAPVKNSAWAALYDGNRYFFRQAAKFAYLFALNEKDGVNDIAPFERVNSTLPRWDMHNFEWVLERLHIPIKRFSESTDSETNTPTKEDSMTDIAIELLRQFYQIIFYGPPGTGKTRRAMGILPELLGDSDLNDLQTKGRWGIVQFHPSYNYEDFVRGVQVKTENREVVYKTVNRVFGDMCALANADPKQKYALIIDEINRANVSAVLGELIYALEYRNKPVDTPYTVGGGEMQEFQTKELIIPDNLYVIGTMNTADRTIGQIDYAVRRRFAFVHCPPDVSVIKNADALSFFGRVDEIFKHISPDFDAADVRVGHSYFLAADRFALANKIIWQVVPILREYVKDGVLQDSATPYINEIEAAAQHLRGEAEVDSPADDDEQSIPGSSLFYRWKTTARSGFDRTSRVWLAFVRDYVKEHNPPNLDSLKTALAARDSSIKKESETTPRSCYMQDIISLADGERVATSKHSWNNAEEFADAAENCGYQINSCHIVNIGEGASRSWEDSHKYGFISAGGTQSYHTQIGNLKKGDFIFVKWAQDAPVRGCIACGEVVAEAEKLAEFKTTDGKLLIDCETESGEKFRDKYQSALEREYPDLAVAVKWVEDVSDKPIRLRTVVRQFRVARIDNRDWLEFRRRFKILGEKEGH